jgi:methionine-rich copper-binding protein CopC
MMPAATSLMRWRFTLAAFAPALAWSALAGAHPFLDHATPAADSAARASPAKVQLWFSEPLEPAFSTVEVRDDADKRVDKGDPQVDGANRKLLEVSLPRLGSGKYRVSWRVLSVDTHVSQGAFAFEVTP